MPLLWISVSFLAGIVLAATMSLPTWAWAVIALVFLILSLFLRRSILVTRYSLLSTRLLQFFTAFNTDLHINPVCADVNPAVAVGAQQ